MNKKVRLFLALLILAASVSLLVWAYSPNPRETRVQSIAPAEMQLPVP
jgi:hypothetical protein